MCGSTMVMLLRSGVCVPLVCARADGVECRCVCGYPYALVWFGVDVCGVLCCSVLCWRGVLVFPLVFWLPVFSLCLVVRVLRVILCLRVLRVLVFLRVRHLLCCLCFALPELNAVFVCGSRCLS